MGVCSVRLCYLRVDSTCWRATLDVIHPTAQHNNVIDVLARAAVVVVDVPAEMEVGQWVTGLCQ